MENKHKETYDLLENVICTGNLYKLTSEQRLSYYKKLCESLDLNPLTMPFKYLEKDTSTGKELNLYLTKGGSEQLRSRLNISIEKIEKSKVDYEDGEKWTITVYGICMDNNRRDISTATVFIEKNPKDYKGNILSPKYKGEYMSNLHMKLETKGKRRLTISFSGLGISDESEIDSIPYSRPYVDEDKKLETDLKLLPQIPLNTLMEECKESMMTSRTIDELKNIFGKYYIRLRDSKEYENKKESIKIITEEYKKIKNELEFSLEMEDKKNERSL